MKQVGKTIKRISCWWLTCKQDISGMTKVPQIGKADFSESDKYLTEGATCQQEIGRPR
jgi:hypothetical protein